MPPMTSVQTFIEAIRSGQTNITRAFDSIFTKPYANQPWLGAIQDPGAFNGAPDQWAPELVEALEQAGLTSEEIEHIGSWADDLKEQARQVCVEAMTAGRNVRFRWGFGQGPEPALDPPPQTGADPHRVWFATPRSALEQVGADEVQIGLYGTPDQVS